MKLGTFTFAFLDITLNSQHEMPEDFENYFTFKTSEADVTWICVMG